MAITHKEIVDIMILSRPNVSDEFALKTIDMFPTWDSVIGVKLTQENIDKGLDRYQYNGKLYQLIQPHTTQEDWTPDKTPALWKEVSLEEYPEWEQPSGAHDAYKKNDKVTHNGKKWISIADANVWEPGVYGWSKVAK